MPPGPIQQGGTLVDTFMLLTGGDGDGGRPSRRSGPLPAPEAGKPFDVYFEGERTVNRASHGP